MITLYFTYRNKQTRRCYAEITCESTELAKDIFSVYHKEDYTGIYPKEKFNPAKDQLLTTVIKQILRNQNND